MFLVMFTVSCNSSGSGNESRGTEQSSNGSEGNSKDDSVAEETLEITGPANGVYGYTEKLRKYLTAEGDNVKVTDYAKGESVEAYNKISIT